MRTSKKKSLPPTKEEAFELIKETLATLSLYDSFPDPEMMNLKLKLTDFVKRDSYNDKNESSEIPKKDSKKHGNKKSATSL